jgi:hypothetical protein
MIDRLSKPAAQVGKRLMPEKLEAIEKKLVTEVLR